METWICGILAVICLIISILHFQQKGFLLNNAYLFASKEERKHMDKAPHYRQSGVVFALLSAGFFCLTVQSITHTERLMPVFWIVCSGTVIYAVLSSIPRK